MQKRQPDNQRYATKIRPVKHSKLKIVLPLLSRWTRIEVEQSEDEGLKQFVFIVRVDREDVAKVINNKPRSFSKVGIFEQVEKLYEDSFLFQMNVYASNPWHESMPGKIRNLVISEKIERTMGQMQYNPNADHHTMKRSSEIGDNDYNGVIGNNSTSCPKGLSLF